MNPAIRSTDRPRSLEPIALLLAVACLAVLLAAVLSASPAARQPPSTPVTFWCSMHPDVRGGAGEKCRRCAVDLIPMPSNPYESYPVDIDTIPRAPLPGKPTQLQFLARSPATGAVVHAFDVIHEHLFHLFVVSHDLAFFTHVHPALGADGRFKETIALPKTGAYRLILDFAPSGSAPQLVQRTIATAGFDGALFDPPKLETDVAVKVAGATRIRLYMLPAVVGRAQNVMLELQDAVTGVPVTDLEPFLGAAGHLLIVAADLQSVSHNHPVAGLSSPAGPRVAFRLVFPYEGTFRFWAQFQRHGQVLTAPFTVHAGPEGH